MSPSPQRDRCAAKVTLIFGRRAIKVPVTTEQFGSISALSLARPCSPRQVCHLAVSLLPSAYPRNLALVGGQASPMEIVVPEMTIGSFGEAGSESTRDSPNTRNRPPGQDSGLFEEAGAASRATKTAMIAVRTTAAVCVRRATSGTHLPEPPCGVRRPTGEPRVDSLAEPRDTQAPRHTRRTGTVPASA